jgi:hypothetical protein
MIGRAVVCPGLSAGAWIDKLGEMNTINLKPGLHKMIESSQS